MQVGFTPRPAAVETNTTIDSIVRQVGGNLTYEDCDTLWGIVDSLPAGATILDVNPGQGRSTVVLSKALNGKRATILSVGIKKADLNGFSHHNSSFGTGREVVPVLADLGSVKEIFSKRSVNMALLQLPPFDNDNLSVIDSELPFLRSVLRSGGYVVFLCPTGGHTGFVEQLVSKDADLTITHQTDRMIVLHDSNVEAEKKGKKK